MRIKLSLAVFLISLGMAIDKPLAGDISKKLALVVGVNTYANLKNADLRTPADDARRVANYLDKAEGFKGGVKRLGARPEDDKPLSSSPRRDEIIGAWDQLINRARDIGLTGGNNPSDGAVLIFYFSGHGVVIDGENYLVAGDTAKRQDGTFDKDTAVSLSQLYQRLANLTLTEPGLDDLAGIFILDACRDEIAGATDGEMSKGHARLAPPKQVFVMYASAIGQKANVGTGKESIFTKALVDTLEDLDAPIKDQPIGQLARQVAFSVSVLSAKEQVSQLPATYDQLERSRSLFGDLIKNADIARPVKGAFFGAVLPVSFLAKLKGGDVFLECNGCPDMVRLPTGDPARNAFVLGPDQSGKTVPVKIGMAISIGRFELTKADWNLCVDDQDADPAVIALKCDASSRQNIKRVPSPVRAEPGQLRDREPVSGITWDQANRYAKWLSRKVTNAARITDKDAAEIVYRLPSEAEWEYAARGGTKTDYSFSSHIDAKVRSKKTGQPVTQCDFANGADQSMSSLGWMTVAGCKDGYGRRAAPVGSFEPNPFGLYDMHGNVWEWVADCWHASHDGNPGDGSARSGDKDCARRVARGGSWHSGPQALQSNARNAFPPGLEHRTIGFRLVRDM